MDKYEQSLLTEYKASIWDNFVRAIDDYAMIEAGDKIAVCISGGKDSMLMAKLFQLYRRECRDDFELEYIVMDPGYNAPNRRQIEYNAELLGIPITVFESNIFDVTVTVEKSPCYLCARMRRGHLYAKAQELGCNKIALGHHLSDVIETTLIGMFYGSQLQAMLPKLNSTNFEGMELIRPLYRINEDDIISWSGANGLEFIQCACRFTEAYHNADDGIGESKRQEVKHLIRELKKTLPDVEQSIFESIHNLDISTMIEYKTDGQIHNFLDEYKKN